MYDSEQVARFDAVQQHIEAVHARSDGIDFEAEDALFVERRLHVGEHDARRGDGVCARKVSGNSRRLLF